MLSVPMHPPIVMLCYAIHPPIVMLCYAIHPPIVQWFPSQRCAMECEHASIARFYLMLAGRLHRMAARAMPTLGLVPTMHAHQTAPRLEQCTALCKATNAWAVAVIVSAGSSVCVGPAAVQCGCSWVPAPGRSRPPPAKARPFPLGSTQSHRVAFALALVVLTSNPTCDLFFPGRVGCCRRWRWRC
jgi:hypothetical protein